MEFYFLLVVTILVAAQTIWNAWSTGSDSPTWSLRWRALAPADQARLAVAGLSRTSTAALTDPERRDLAEGFGHRERRLRSRLELALLAVLALMAALSLVGIATDRTFALVFGSYTLLRWGIDGLRDWQIKRRLRTSIASTAEPAATSASQAATLRDSLTYLLVGVIAAIAFVVLVRIGKDDDPAWEERWNDLSPAERTRIAAATRSGALLASEEEIELAAGFAHRDRRQRSPCTLVDTIRLLLGIALIAGGLAADSIILLVFGVFFFVGGVWMMRSIYRVARAEREAIARDHSF